MSISEPFIKRPVGTSLLAIGLFAMGIVAYRFLPVAPIPRVDFPMIAVSASLPGADPATVASSLAAPLERRFSEISGVTELTSTSTLGGASINIQFDLNRPVTDAARDVQAAISAAASELPINLPNPPTYHKTNPADAPIMILSMTSDSRPGSSVFEFGDEILGQRLSQVNGVSQVMISGGEKSAVRVQMNPAALASTSLGLEDVRNFLQQVNVDKAKGSVDGKQASYTIYSNDQLFEASDYQNLVVASPNGTPILLRSLGSVIEGVEDVHNAGSAGFAEWGKSRTAVLVIVFKKAEANIIDTVDRIRDVLPQTEKWIPPDVQIKVLSDRTHTIRASVEEVQFSLLLSVALVVMVIFLFLRRFWPTFIASITVPLAISGTFAVMYLCNYTIDNLSLMAVTISVGFVVDDAIVVIENVFRFIEKGEKTMPAAIKGARQIGFTVVSMSLSLVAVFIPLLFMSGLVGRLLHEFAVTLSAAILVSGVVSLTLTPMLCSRFLKPESAYGEPGRFYRACEGAFNWMLNLYSTCLKWVLRHQVLMLGVAVATVVLTVWFYTIVPKGFFPIQDTGLMMGTTEGAQDISFEAMKKLQDKLAEIVLADPAVDTIGSFLGSSRGGSVANNGRFFISLKPLSERKVGADEIIQRLRQADFGDPRHLPLSTVKPGYSTRRARLERRVPVRPGIGRSQPLERVGAEGNERLAQAPATQGREQRSADAWTPIQRDRGSRCGGASRHLARVDRRHALRCLWPAAGLDDLSAVQSAPRDPRSRPGLSKGSRFAGQDLRQIQYRPADPPKHRGEVRHRQCVSFRQSPGTISGGDDLLCHRA